MDKNRHVELQKNIVDNAEEMNKTMADLQAWVNEIKSKEKQRGKDVASEAVEQHPIRSSLNEELKMNKEIVKDQHISPPPSKVTKDCNLEEIKTSMRKEEANISKDEGNGWVKIGEYEKAIECYSTAISIFDGDPVFYTNRALCYLKLERYNQCIEDCNKALEISPLTVKAYYRRMQANESLGENSKALADCESILKIDGKNTETKQSLQRIKLRMQKSTCSSSKPTRAVFTKMQCNMKEIMPINKPAHLRSKKPLKRIAIEDVIGEKSYENSRNDNAISDEEIDKLFNSYCGSFTEVNKKGDKLQSEESIEKPHNNNGKMADKDKIKVEGNRGTKVLKSEISANSKQMKEKENQVGKAQRKIETNNKSLFLEKLPISTAQFHASWREASRDQKYLILINIDPTKLNQILGAGLDSETVTEIFEILKDYYIRDKRDVGKILLEISRHSEMSILSFFLSTKDYEVINELIKWMKENQDDVQNIETIKLNFNVK